MTRDVSWLRHRKVHSLGIAALQQHKAIRQKVILNSNIVNLV